MCDPDFNVWSDSRPNEVGRAGANGRCAGGHIHIGYNNHNRITSNYLIKALDLFISVPLVIMEPNNRRKEMYGKAGAFRQQPWGVEYRSPSNFILSSSELMKWAFNQVLKAIEFVNNDETRILLDKNQYCILNAINNNNTSSAKRLIEEFKLEVLEKVLTN